MRHLKIICDWCGTHIDGRYVGYQVRHIGAFTAYDGERFDFDFCDDQCLNEWRAHDRRPRRLGERQRDNLTESVKGA